MKKLMGTEKNKKKREERQKKQLVRFEKFLSLKAMHLLRQKVEKEEQPALKQTKEQLAKCKRQLESLMKCANNLFDELEFTNKQAIHLCSFHSDMPAGEDKNACD